MTSTSITPDVLRDWSASARFQKNPDNRQQVRVIACVAGTLSRPFAALPSLFLRLCRDSDALAISTAYDAQYTPVYLRTLRTGVGQRRQWSE